MLAMHAILGSKTCTENHLEAQITPCSLFQNQKSRKEEEWFSEHHAGNMMHGADRHLPRGWYQD